jgi:hypothetical protein
MATPDRTDSMAAGADCQKRAPGLHDHRSLRKTVRPVSASSQATRAPGALVPHRHRGRELERERGARFSVLGRTSVRPPAIRHRWISDLRGGSLERAVPRPAHPTRPPLTSQSNTTLAPPLPPDPGVQCEQVAQAPSAPPLPLIAVSSPPPCSSTTPSATPTDTQPLR